VRPTGVRQADGSYDNNLGSREIRMNVRRMIHGKDGRDEQKKAKRNFHLLSQARRSFLFSFPIL
jgi:hypothetical protein